MRPRRLRVVVESSFGWLAVLAGATTWWAIYQSPQAVLMVFVTASVGVSIGALGARFRWNTAIVALATIVAFLVLGVPLAVPSGATAGVIPTLDGLRQLVVSTALGWKQLVTIALPVGSYQGLLVPLFVLVLLVSVVSVTAALRASPRFGDLAVLAPAVLFVAGIALGAETVRLPRLAASVMLVLAVGWLVVRHRSSRLGTGRGSAGAPLPQIAAPGTARLRLQSVVSGSLILVVAGSAGLLLSAGLPPVVTRQVVRTAIEQPFDPRAYTSPLAGYRSYLAGGEDDAVQLSITGLPVGALVRIATLDSYDGIVYSVGSDVDGASGYFTRVPDRFGTATTTGQAARIGVTVQGYSGVWLPTVGSTESLDFEGSDAPALRDAFYVNETSGTAVDTAGLRQGDRYTVSALVPTALAASRVSTLSPGSADLPAIGALPAELEVALEGYTQSAATPGDRLAAMLDGLARNGYVSDGLPGEEASRSGHSADRITQLLTDDRMIGDAEQYSVTAALMARQLGFPARVVFGFAPRVTAGQVTQVRGSDVSAWIEVDTADRGWVSIDPTPVARPIPPPDTTKPDVVSRPPSIVQPPAVAPPDTQQQSPPESTQNPAAPVDPLLGLLLLVTTAVCLVLLVLLVAAAPFVAVAVVKSRRRRRRRSRGSPRQRASAAWSEFEDAVVDHGLPVGRSATRSEFAAAVGAPAGLVVAAVADRASFAPEALDEAEAARVWAAVDELRAGLDRRASRRGRLAARISLRSLRGRARG